ncbi:MAG: AraC family transcriptional regulator [Anaerobutyricum hallii]|uniref:helix-turn-helix transcriptional regulator n=1 Tax=Anaerobutyricum hallii TaxID=39488 RepID=UPI00242ADE1B|nr:AraC family transcriptional regulator [Anaerobutyricum hallii]MDD6587981.1 AraC family transcriptional regulator [Anaerobutyricum hallii]
METTLHGDEAYPFRYYYENLALFDFNCVDWHWHNELEFVYVECGDVSIDIGDAHFILHTGQGIMINSKALHRFQSESDAIIPNFLFKPSFIAPAESLIYAKYVSPILASSLEYFVFREDIAWQSHALDLIKNIIILQDTDRNRELSVSIQLQKLWLLLLENLTIISSDNKAAVISRTRLQLMMQYIHTHYSENISLEDIAGSAAIGKSTALHLFQDNIKMTPVNYLIKYRLKQAAILLSGTAKKITVISSTIGFNNVDHFCRSFKKIYGITPTDYRKQSDMTTAHGISLSLHP